MIPISGPMHRIYFPMPIGRVRGGRDAIAPLKPLVYLEKGWVYG